MSGQRRTIRGVEFTGEVRGSAWRQHPYVLWRDQTRDWSEVSWPGAGLPPTRLLFHRTGNQRKSADAPANMAYWWDNRAQGVGSAHAVVDAAGVWLAVPGDRTAWGVKEYRIAERMGFPIRVPGDTRRRGDVRAINIEVCENVGRAAGDPAFPAGVWDNAVAFVVDVLRGKYPELVPGEGLLTPFDIFGHSEFDPWQRPHDPDGIKPVAEIIREIGRALHRSLTVAGGSEAVDIGGLVGDVRMLERRCDSFVDQLKELQLNSHAHVEDPQ